MTTSTTTRKKIRGKWSVLPVPHAELPDGRKLSEYIEYTNWSAPRWAWEFLRRNKQFQQDCENLNPAGKERLLQKKELIRKYGLAHFKHWKEDFGDLAKNQPIFVGTRIRTNLNVAAEDLSDLPPLYLGQALIRIELLPCIVEFGLLEAQIALARKLLVSRITSYAKRLTDKNPRRARLKTNKPADLIALLRLLDLKRSKIGPADRFKKAFPNLARGQEDIDLIVQEKGRLKTAKMFANSGYLSLSLISIQ